MGNKLFVERQGQDNLLKDNKSISQVLDYIATHYIVTMDFKSLRNLYKKEYCDNLVVLTSDIIQRYFTDLEISYLVQRTENGVEVNKEEKDKIIFFNKEYIDRLNVQNSFKKKNMCIAISQFYIKIAHIFAAIVHTINPIYTYTNENGEVTKANLYEKGNIPVNAPRSIEKLNLCQTRIDALQNKNNINPDANGDIYVSPKVCDMNINTNGQIKSLKEEPGIPELMELYYDDKYNFETGMFEGMTSKTKSIYMEDLRIFYNVFTGNLTMPPEITKFGDIKLRDFQNLEQCKGDDADFKKRTKGPLSNELFAKYAQNLKNMIYKTNKNQQALLSVINEIFVYTIDPQTKQKQIRINPKLTAKRLQEIVVETRSLIIKLYLTCEIDYINGLKIYEAIVDKKIFETLQTQMLKLKTVADNLTTMDSIPVPAENKFVEEFNNEDINEKKEEEEKLDKEINDIQVNLDKNKEKSEGELQDVSLLNLKGEEEDRPENASLPKPEGPDASLLKPEGPDASLLKPEGPDASLPKPEGPDASLPEPMNVPPFKPEGPDASLPEPEGPDASLPEQMNVPPFKQEGPDVLPFKQEGPDVLPFKQEGQDVPPLEPMNVLPFKQEGQDVPPLEPMTIPPLKQEEEKEESEYKSETKVKHNTPVLTEEKKMEQQLLKPLSIE